MKAPIKKSLLRKLRKLGICNAGLCEMFVSQFHTENWQKIKEISIDFNNKDSLFWVIEQFKLSMKVIIEYEGSPDDYIIFKNGLKVEEVESCWNSGRKKTIYTWEYNEDGNLLKYAVDGKVRREYVYNKKGQLIKRKFNEYGFVERLIYNRAGKLIREIDPENETIFRYKNGVIFEKERLNGGVKCHSLTKYDAAGRAVEEFFNGVLIAYSQYDGQGKLTLSTSFGEVTCVYYDDSGNRVKEVFINEGENITVLKYYYQPNTNNLIRVSDGTKSLYEFMYDEEGNLIDFRSQAEISENDLKYRIEKYHE